MVSKTLCGASGMSSRISALPACTKRKPVPEYLALPPYSLSKATVDELKRQTAAMAKALKVVGLMNVQFAIQHVDDKDVIYVLEVNPRASRTVPFVSKAIGVPVKPYFGSNYTVLVEAMRGGKLGTGRLLERTSPFPSLPPPRCGPRVSTGVRAG